ncbi:hypothetical protein BO71DRAFT_187901 [Aspergillus ellipticus CBS 707.79]|uniref:Uncharacterized protein n=1 Tax=Aspergillus ellipticus CBS 707.79 TaxID=1448320 RepID=A0A319DF29_9EURO|nr:hypothetical protein BO71DRAFT_187901 [Aspergillus ellipticus CBS 707.79]
MGDDTTLSLPYRLIFFCSPSSFLFSLYPVLSIPFFIALWSYTLSRMRLKREGSSFWCKKLPSHVYYYLLDIERVKSSLQPVHTMFGGIYIALAEFRKPQFSISV